MAHAAWSPLAERDVEEIYQWIARRDGRRQTAKIVIRELRQHCDDYAGSTLRAAFSERRATISARTIACSLTSVG
jgi:plasmid stabilization system protein ParE